MSGGSYNYLYSQELCDFVGTIERMADSLRQAGHVKAALRTEEVVLLLRTASKIKSELDEVWRTEEWRRSGDYEAEQLTECVRDWERKHPLPEDPLREHVVRLTSSLELMSATNEALRGTLFELKRLYDEKVVNLSCKDAVKGT